MKSDKRDSISAIIITLNEEKNIGRCLESVQWADEQIVVDSLSSDRTVEIAKQNGAKVFQRAWTGYADQKQFALDQAKHVWVLSVDADERISDVLKEEIQKILREGSPHAGFYMTRRSYFLGKWIRHGGWYPGHVLRFFRKQKAKLNDVKVHEGFLVEGSIGYLKGDLLHNTHPSIDQSLKKMVERNQWIALERVKRDQKKVRWFDLIVHPVAAFSKKYFSQKGFLDGMHGFMLALVDAMVKLSLYMAMWDLQHSEKKEENLQSFYQK
jgi:glycosyltransferase involved in cell wall biosynthesis